MTFRKYWLALIPLLIGLIAGIILNLPQTPNPLIYLRADLVAVVAISGLALSTIIALIVYIKSQIDMMVETTQEEAFQERRRFLSLLDHELKNPLTAIMAGLANLNAGDSSPTLKSVENQVQQLSRLVTDLRKLSDLETRPMDMTMVDLPELIEDVFELSKSRVGDEKTITLSMPQAPWPLPELMADRDLLFLAVHNVIDNAIKFTENGDTIEIRASEDGNRVQIEVADTGPGIPAEELDQVWTELFRGKGARGIPGSGLGLALVQGIIRRHGGTVAIRSQLDKGTLITLSLPVRAVTDS